MGNDEKSNVILEKSYQFALAVVPIARQLQVEKEFVLSNQLVRSRTAIGALVEEAQAAQTRADFHTKMCIAEKEARETHYWLLLLKDCSLIDEKVAGSLLMPCQELKRILAAITKSTS
jgi:four helix bundle protein